MFSSTLKEGDVIRIFAAPLFFISTKFLIGFSDYNFNILYRNNLKPYNISIYCSWQYYFFIFLKNPHKPEVLTIIPSISEFSFILSLFNLNGLVFMSLILINNRKSYLLFKWFLVNNINSTVPLECDNWIILGLNFIIFF
jgi:hypothetical protein